MSLSFSIWQYNRLFHAYVTHQLEGKLMLYPCLNTFILHLRCPGISATRQDSRFYDRVQNQVLK